MYTKMLCCVFMTLAATLAGACDGSVAVTAGQSTSTRDLLAETVEFPFDQPGSAVALSARPLVGGGVTHRVALPVSDGSVALRVDERGALVLERLVVELGDIDISAQSLPPSGLHLTDLRVTLDQVDVTEVSWSADGAAAVASIAGDLTVDLSLVTNGRVVPLAPQRLRGLQLQVEVGPATDGGVAVTLRGGRGGAFLHPAGFFELSDLSIELTARN